MRNLLFAVLIGAFLMVGTASADRGAWLTTGTATYGNGSGSDWVTFLHVSNNTAGTVTATVTFYAGQSSAEATSLGSTTRVLGANAIWAFHTGAIGNITSTTMVDNVRGVVAVTPDTLDATTSLFYTGTASGFNFRYAE